MFASTKCHYQFKNLVPGTQELGCESRAMEEVLYMHYKQNSRLRLPHLDNHSLPHELNRYLRILKWGMPVSLQFVAVHDVQPGTITSHLPESNLSQPLIVGRHEQRHTRIGRGVVQVDDQILRRDWFKGINS